ncbi:uncharacterized protein C8Q71DRAFT_722942 [Rhodofomes roseus]|uniref:DUF6532 domain-containing protein n=1 Tax=Rhodofomes roseus TaxID=34475 RepID=A0ABQ8KHX4_9APHY|nr:uncharacterized protein C8Q71DRAFT_722942 [Rhodofomes roseus]KAH9837601.1 hypothetical protein C8Q71DRAFT_722942 [Rhodofomes roseus]
MASSQQVQAQQQAKPGLPSYRTESPGSPNMDRHHRRRADDYRRLVHDQKIARIRYSPYPTTPSTANTSGMDVQYCDVGIFLTAMLKAEPIQPSILADLPDDALAHMIKAKRMSRKARVKERDTMEVQISEKEQQILLLRSLIQSHDHCIQLVDTHISQLESHAQHREISIDTFLHSEGSSPDEGRNSSDGGDDSNEDEEDDEEDGDEDDSDEEDDGDENNADEGIGNTSGESFGLASSDTAVSMTRAVKSPEIGGCSLMSHRGQGNQAGSQNLGRGRAAVRPAQPKNVREYRAADLNPSAMPQGSQIDIRSEQPSVSAAFVTHSDWTQHEDYTEDGHHYAFPEPETQDSAQVFNQQPESYNPLASESYQTSMPSYYTHEMDPGAGASASQYYIGDGQSSSVQVYGGGIQSVQTGVFEAQQASGSSQASTGTSFQVQDAPHPGGPYSIPYPVPGSVTVRPDQPEGFTTVGLSNIGPERYPLRASAGSGPPSTSIMAQPYPAPSTMSGNVSGIPELLGGAPRVVQTRPLSSNIVLTHRERSRPTRVPSTSSHGPPAEWEAMYSGLMQSLQAAPAQPMLQDLSSEDIKACHLAYSQAAKRLLEEYIALTIPFPDSTQVSNKISAVLAQLHAQELDKATIGPDKKRFSAWNNSKLIKAGKEVIATLRGQFKQAAITLLPVLVPGLRHYNIDFDASEDTYAIDTAQLDDVAKQLRDDRAHFVGKLLSSSVKETELLHIMDTQGGTVIGAFEKDNLVQHILDSVVFQRPGGLYSTHRHLFSNGTPDALIALAGTAAIASLEEFEGLGSRKSRDFTREAYRPRSQTLMAFIRDLKASDEHNSRFERLGLNIVRYGSGWGQGLVDEDA